MFGDLDWPLNNAFRGLSAIAVFLVLSAVIQEQINDDDAIVVVTTMTTTMVIPHAIVYHLHAAIYILTRPDPIQRTQHKVNQPGPTRPDLWRTPPRELLERNILQGRTPYRKGIRPCNVNVDLYSA